MRREEDGAAALADVIGVDFPPTGFAGSPSERMTFTRTREEDSTVPLLPPCAG